MDRMIEVKMKTLKSLLESSGRLWSQILPGQFLIFDLDMSARLVVLSGNTPSDRDFN